MKQQVDDRTAPDTRDDPLNPANKKYPSDGSHDKITGGLRPDETAAFDQIAAGLDDTAGQETNASTDDGNMTATNEAEDRLGRGYNDGKSKTKTKSRSRTKRYASTIAVAVIASAIFGAVAFLPTIAMKTMMSKVTDAFMDRVNYALENRAEKYVEKYVNKMIKPSLQQCRTKITKDCTVVDPGKGFVGNLMSNWRNAGIETKLFDKYGLDFKLDTRDENKIKVYKTNRLGITSEVGDFDRSDVFKEVSRVMRQETGFSGVFDRLHMRSLIKSKYGLDGCLIGCKTRANLDEYKLNQVKKLKLKLYARVVEPANSKAAAYLLCFTLDCSPDEITKEVSEAATNALRRTEAEALEEIAADIGDRKLSQYITEKALEKLLSQLMEKTAAQRTAQSAASAVPVAGQIYLGVVAVDFLDRVYEKLENRELSQFLQERNEAAAAVYSSQFLLANDDILSGVPDLGESGAAFELINGYGESRLWQSVNKETVTSQVACRETVLSGPGDPLVCPEKQLRQTLAVEEFVNDPFVSGLVSTLNVYDRCAPAEINGKCVPPAIRPKTVVRQALSITNGLSNLIGGAAFAIIDKTPGIGELFEKLQSLTAEYASKALEAIVTKLFPLSINADAEDGELLDQVASGLDVTSNLMLKGETFEDGTTIGLGASQIGPAAQAELQVAIEKEKELETKSQSAFTRYFDINNSSSLIASGALGLSGSIPTQATELRLGVPNFASSLLGLFGLNKKVLAAGLPSDRESIFGVTQYGFALEDQALTIDPDELTPERCTEFASIRESTATIDPDTNQKVYTRSNPCMLDDVVTTALSKIYSLDAGGSSSTQETAIDPASFTFDAAGKAKDTSALPCAAGATSERITSVGSGSIRVKLCSYEGIRDINASWSSAVSRMLRDAKKDGISISGGGFRTAQSQINLRRSHCGPTPYDIYLKPSRQCNPPTARPGSSNHELGLAIDVSEITSACGVASGITTCTKSPTYRWLVQNAGKYGIQKLSSEAWHWSVDGK